MFSANSLILTENGTGSSCELGASWLRDNPLDFPASYKVWIEHGGDVNSTSRDKGTPLIFATKQKYMKSMKLLISYGANVNLQDVFGKTALHYVFRESLNLDLNSSNYNAYKCLLEHGANPNIKDNFNESPFQLILKYGSERDLQLFIDNGAKIDIKSMDLLKFAVQNRWSKMFEKLLSDYAADATEEIQKNGSLLLCYAAQSSLILNVKILCERGADINSPDSSGKTPIIYLGCQKTSDIFGYDFERFLDFLIDLGADVNACDQNGITVIKDKYYETFERNDNLVYSSNIQSIMRSLVKYYFFNRVPDGIVFSEIRSLERSSDYYKKCMDELMLLKDHVICENLSIVPILMNDKKTMTRYARNKKFIEMFNATNLTVMFPVYGSFIEKRFASHVSSTKALSMLRAEATKVLLTCLPQKLKVDLVLQGIINFLDVNHLFALTNSELNYSVNLTTGDLSSIKE